MKKEGWVKKDTGKNCTTLTDLYNAHFGIKTGFNTMLVNSEILQMTNSMNW